MRRRKKKPKAKRVLGARGEDHLKLPVGQVLTVPVKGGFTGLPMVSWAARRDKTNTPLVMIVFLLFRDDHPRGTLQVEIPYLEETELATVAFLDALGWDGRVWPTEPGWPDGTGDDEEQVRALLTEAKLDATLIFVPTEDGNHPTTSLNVQRARGPFLMAPLDQPPPDYDQPRLREKLKLLCSETTDPPTTPRNPNG